MTREQFKKQLDKLQEVIMRGLAYYAVWKKLRLHDADNVPWSLDQQSQILGRFRGFFTPVTLALLDMALMQFAKMFDTDRRTASLTNLLLAAQGNSSLVPHISPGDLRKISRQIEQSDTLLRTLKQKRDQDLAHVDASPAPVDPLLTKDFDKLAECVKSAFKTLSGGFGMEELLETSGQHTAQVLDILLTDMGRRQQEFDEEMVRIGLDHVRRTETEIGFQLNKEGVRSAIQSLGLTEEQMQRIEEQYSSDARESVSS